MSKIICDVCGTSYPETASQCPICGCVHPADSHSVSGNTESAPERTYTYVKGGRFSKSNVRKRNSAAVQKSGQSERTPSSRKNEEKPAGRGLVITAVLLLLAIIALVLYLAIRYFVPMMGGTPAKDTTASTLDSQVQTEPPVLSCEKVTLNASTFSFSQPNEARMLYATVEPADCTDRVEFSSSDEAVATVNAEGKVTAVANGTCVITVSCGNKTAECKVTVTLPEPTEETTVPETTEETMPANENFRLNREDITFSYKGESWVIYNGSLSLSAIKWSSGDENVATITNGKVVAVGNGMTTVYAEYAGEKVSCIIRCSFSESQGVGGSGGGITEDG